MRELESRIGRDDLGNVGSCTVKEPVRQLDLCCDCQRQRRQARQGVVPPFAPSKGMETLEHMDRVKADIRETSRVKFSTVPGWTRPMLSFHP